MFLRLSAVERRVDCRNSVRNEPWGWVADADDTPVLFVQNWSDAPSYVAHGNDHACDVQGGQPHLETECGLLKGSLC